MSKKAVISVSTKTGDAGETGLANGQRLSKADQRFAVVGALDELNSWLGLVVAKLPDAFAEHRTYLLTVQETLFYLGAEVAQSPKAQLQKKALEQLEENAANLQEQLVDDWHTRFLLPGGTELGAWLDIARTVCRRVERELVILNQNTKVRPLLLQYINRLSDYFYILRCFVNDALEYEERQFVA